MGLLCLIGSAVSAMLAFSSYPWVNQTYAMAGAPAAFLLALFFISQGKIIELLAVVSARAKSRFAIDNMAKLIPTPVAPGTTPAPIEKKPGIITQPVKERVIHVPDEQARQQGFKVK
jgi:hypothetical protein